MSTRPRPGLVVAVVVLLAAWGASGQDVPAGPPLQLARPEGLSAPGLDSARRARACQGERCQFRSTAADAEIAREDRSQTKSSALPALSHTTQYLGTQSNDFTPNGRFVTNDGVHLFRSWAVLRGEISAKTLSKAPYRRAEAAEALAQARVDVAQRGLAVTVTKSYYTLVTAERRYATAQLAAEQARRFFDTSQQRQRLGEVARSDVVKAEIQYHSRSKATRKRCCDGECEAEPRSALFPTLNANFTVVDDLSSRASHPRFRKPGRWRRENPDLRVPRRDQRGPGMSPCASRLLRRAPSTRYGIGANRFALHSVADAFQRRASAEPGILCDRQSHGADLGLGRVAQQGAAGGNARAVGASGIEPGSATTAQQPLLDVQRSAGREGGRRQFPARG